MDWYRLARPALFALPPECAHRAALLALRSGLLPQPGNSISPRLSTRVFGLTFISPLGLAAGFDKNAEVVNPLLQQGFGFVETGTVTPLPQKGNPQPRLFRLRNDEAVINRLGFNNHGCEIFLRNFSRRTRSLGVAGVNIGKNRDSADAKADYLALLEAAAPHADYITVNISSPNTKGLRDLQNREALDELLSALQERRAALAARPPLLLKIAPDLTMPELEAVAQVALEHGIDGVILTNTTISRPPGLTSPEQSEQGGLSGRPLFPASTGVLRSFYRLTQGRLPLVGVGGIASGLDAYTKIRAGASLVQLYTALIYQGFGLIGRIHAELDALLERDGFSHVAEAVGVDVRS